MTQPQTTIEASVDSCYDKEPNKKFTTRILVPTDFRSFQAIRLEALSGADAQFFGASYKDELGQSDDKWIERCTESDEKAVFGLFCNDNLVGIMAATKWEHDPTGKTLLWGSAYVKPDRWFRHRNNAAALYEIRLDWSLAHPQFEKVIMFIRANNETSTRIHEKNGAIYTHSTLRLFADGNLATANWYEKSLSNMRRQNLNAA